MPTWNRLSALARLPIDALRLLSHGDARLNELTSLTRRSRAAQGDAAEHARGVEHNVARVRKKVDDVAGDIRRVRTAVEALTAEVHERMLQYNLQVGRLARGLQDAAPRPAARRRLTGRPLPLSLPSAEPPGWASVGDGMPHPDPERREWVTLDACAVCGDPARTIVNEWNKLAVLQRAPDAGSERYDYAVCHACGVLYATRRPTGERFRYLLTHFGEVTGKAGGGRAIQNPLLNPYPLTDEDRATLERLASRGVFVSDHLGLRKKDYLDGLMRDRFENSVHVDLLATLAPPVRGRVLEVRPRTGAIADALRRLFQADVSVLPIWESQQFLLKAVYGLNAPALVDFDRFEAPGDEPYDLIVCNHMLTHAVRPAEFFRTLRTRLRPGGHLYLYNEPDDAEFLSGPQSMIVTLNPLHMQAFDQASLRRALASAGFDVVFMKRRNLNHLCLARAGAVSWRPMSDDERTQRIDAYRRARDRAILRAPESVRARFAGEWEALVARGVADGTLDFDEKGHMRLTTADMV